MERPGVVWFGEPLPGAALARAVEAVAAADVLLVVGTSAVVYPAAGLVPHAIAAGARVIEVNPEGTGWSRHVLAVRGPAAEVLPAIVGGLPA
jgi:NAD-dependent deacetylase